MRSWLSSIGALTIALGVAPLAAAFSFSHTNGSQCRDITLQWSGGEGPFYATVVPSWSEPGARIQNITIPTAAGEAGLHTFRLDQVAGSRYTIVMSDATGWGAGGVTPVLRSQPSNDTSCLGPMVGFDFYFYLTPPETPTRAQCSSFGITWDMTITYPLQLLAIVPGSAAFSIPVPQIPSENSITWDLAVREGAQVQLLMANAGLYGTGGATNMTNVTSGGAGCLSGNSPGAGTGEVTILTSIQGSLTSSVTRTGSASSSASSTMSRNGSGMGGGGGGGGDGGSNNAGAIAGGVVGGVAAILLVLLLLFCLRRKRQREAAEAGDKDEAYPPMRQASDMARSSFDILGGPAEQGHGSASSGDSPPLTDAHAHGEPFVSPFPAPQHQRHSRGSMDMDGRGPLPWGAAGAAGAGAGAGAQRHSGTWTGGTNPDSAAATENYAGYGAGVGAGAGAGAGMGMGHARNASFDTMGTANPRGSRKISGVFGETAPSSPTVRSGFESGVPPGATALAGSPLGTRNSRAMWSADNMDMERYGEQPMRRSSADVRYIQHEDSDVVELPPQYNQLRTRNPDESG